LCYFFYKKCIFYVIIYNIENNSGERMKKITVIIKDDTILFKYRKNKLTEPNLLNTNVISNNELVFSDEYLKENTKIVSLFIKELISEKNITKIVISNNELACIVLDLLKNVQTIEELSITDNDNLTYALCEKVIKYKNIKKLNCITYHNL